MAHWYKFALYYLWIAPHVLLAVVPVLMYTRRMHKNFPVFFFYTLYETFEFLLLFATYTSGRGTGVLYRYVYITTMAGSTALRFGIVQEIFNNVFHDYPRLEGSATTLMRWVTGLLLVAAIVTALYSSGAVADNLMVGVSLLSRSVTIIQAGLLLFLFLFSRMFGLSWRSFVFGIAFGFAIFSSTELAFWAARLTDPTEHTKSLMDLVPTGSYHVSVLVWLGYLLAAEKPVGAATYTVPEMDQWSGELERPR
ncbi:MAG: hypothetical protein ACHP79_02260 [Terriglobales bacterium]